MQVFTSYATCLTRWRIW